MTRTEQILCNWSVIAASHMQEVTIWVYGNRSLNIQYRCETTFFPPCYRISPFCHFKTHWFWKLPKSVGTGHLSAFAQRQVRRGTLDAPFHIFPLSLPRTFSHTILSPSWPWSSIRVSSILSLLQTSFSIVALAGQQHFQATKHVAAWMWGSGLNSWQICLTFFPFWISHQSSG